MVVTKGDLFDWPLQQQKKQSAQATHATTEQTTATAVRIGIKVSPVGQLLALLLQCPAPQEPYSQPGPEHSP